MLQLLAAVEILETYGIALKSTLQLPMANCVVRDWNVKESTD